MKGDSQMIKIVLLIPTLLLIAGVLFGLASMKRATAFLTIWLSITVGLMFTSLYWLSNEPTWALLGIAGCGVMVFTAPFLATCFGYTAPPNPNPPVKKAMDAYNNLDDESKEKVREFARGAVKAASAEAAHQLGRKGFPFAAKIFKLLA